MEQVIFRIHHQLYYWLEFDAKETDVINIEKIECLSLGALSKACTYSSILKHSVGLDLVK